MEAIYFYEIWAPITQNIVKNICPYYLISSFGRIYSTYSNRLLTPVIDKYGYEVICLHLTETKDTCKRNQTTERVNRLVLLTFCPINNPELFEADHVNRDRRNNKLWNLRWLTPEENQKNRVLCGMKGSDNPMSKLTEEKVLNIIYDLYSNKYSFREISNKYNISSTTVESIAYNKRWNCLGIDVDQEKLRVSSAFSNQEIENICNYFSKIDINNVYLYPNI